MKQKSAFFITIALLVAVLTSCSGGAILAASEGGSSPDTTEQTVSDLATSVQDAPQDAESAQDDGSGAASRPAGWTKRHTAALPIPISTPSSLRTR